jgi:hypothetical protein
MRVTSFRLASAERASRQSATSPEVTFGLQEVIESHVFDRIYFAPLPQQCHNSKFVVFQEKLLKVLKCYNFL